ASASPVPPAAPDRPPEKAPPPAPGKRAWPPAALATTAALLLCATGLLVARSSVFSGGPRGQESDDTATAEDEDRIVDADAQPTPILRVRPDLAGLPFQSGPSCKLHSTTAQNLDTLSRKLRVYLTRLTPVGPDGRRPNPAQLEDTFRREKRGKSPEWKRPEAVPTLVQLLMHEEPPLRRILVEMLA